jgi:hypothetical protein
MDFEANLFITEKGMRKKKGKKRTDESRAA